MSPSSFSEASVTLILKPDKENKKKKKTRDEYSHEYGCKYPQENISTWNPATYKKDYTS